MKYCLLKKDLMKSIQKHTGKTVEEIKSALERDNFMKENRTAGKNLD